MRLDLIGEGHRTGLRKRRFYYAGSRITLDGEPAHESPAAGKLGGRAPIPRSAPPISVWYWLPLEQPVAGLILKDELGAAAARLCEDEARVQPYSSLKHSNLSLEPTPGKLRFLNSKFENFGPTVSGLRELLSPLTSILASFCQPGRG